MWIENKVVQQIEEYHKAKNQKKQEKKKDATVFSQNINFISFAVDWSWSANQANCSSVNQFRQSDNWSTSNTTHWKCAQKLMLSLVA